MKKNESTILINEMQYKFISFKNKKNIIFKKIRYLFFIPLSIIIFLILLHKIVFYKKNNNHIPKVSVFMAVYNKENYLHNTIESLQNQTLKDIEIIAVDDCSTDNSLKVLQEMAKKDSRIKVVNYEKNRGPLYARALGILNSKGEYLLNIDSDDILYGNDTLEFLYNRANKSNIDVILYSRLITHPNGFKQVNIRCNSFDRIIRQPELYQIAFNQYNQLSDYLIWNKFIKKEVYLRAYKAYEKRINGENWIHYDDNIWGVLIHKYANTLECINKTLYIHILNPTSLTNKIGSLTEVKSVIDKYEMFKEIYNTKEEKKYLIKEFENLMYLIDDYGSFRNFFNENSYIKNWTIKTCNDFINEFKDPTLNYLIKEAKHFLRKISANKIIIFKEDFYNLENNLIYKSMQNFFKNKTNRTLVHVDILRKENIKDIKYYIYPDDIIVGLNVELFNYNWSYFGKEIIDNYTNNKILLFSSRHQDYSNISNLIFKNNSNVNIFFNDKISFNLSNKYFNGKKYYIPNIATYYDEYFEKERKSKKENILIIFKEMEDSHYLEKIKNIISKYFKSITVNYKDIIANKSKNDDQYLPNIMERIKENEIILTNDWYGMMISAISGISCIIFDSKNIILKSEYNWFKELDYIRFVNNIESDLEKEILLLKNKTTPNIYNKSIYNTYYDLIKNIIKTDG